MILVDTVLIVTPELRQWIYRECNGLEMVKHYYFKI